MTGRVVPLEPSNAPDADTVAEWITDGLLARGDREGIGVTVVDVAGVSGGRIFTVRLGRCPAVSDKSYRAAVQRLRETLDLLGPYRDACGLCGHPDARHRSADAIAERVEAGDDLSGIAADYGTGLGSPGDIFGVENVLRVTVAVLSADPRRHGLTRGKAAGIDREVWGHGD